MKINYKEYLNVIGSRNVLPTLIVILLTISAIIGVVFVSLRVYDQYMKLQTVRSDVTNLRSSIELIKNNRQLLANSVDDYNSILEKLIPDNESYFLVIAALEQLALRNGVEVTQYSINLSSTTEEKLTLDITVEGDASSLRQFMKNYQYVSGRLLTNQKVSLDFANLESITFAINFYHKKFADNVASNAKITQKDIDEVVQIGEQMQ